MHQRGLVVLAVVVLISSFAAPAVTTVPASTAAQSAGSGVPSDPTTIGSARAPGGVTTAAGPASTSAGSLAAADIRLTTRLALTPERPGEVGVTLRFDVPDRVTELDVTVAPDAKGVTTTGFSAAAGDTYEWDGDTATPTISYRLPANRTAETGRFDRRPPASLAADPHARGAGAGTVDGATGPADAASATTAGEGYVFVDTGPWAMVRVPTPGLSWRYRGEAVEVSREATTDGPGTAGDRIAFLGEHTVRERTANGQTFRLVIPERSTDAMVVSPDAVLDSLSSASGTLRAGDRDESVFVVAAPTGVDWAVRGLQTGDADAWVRAGEPLDTVESPWLHEYVHTRQSYRTTAATRWTIEGSADYYAALLALEQGRIGFPAFADHLARGARDPHTDAVLAEPGTWASAATQYRKGSLVTGELDRRIRLATGGGATYGAVLARLNAETDPVTGDRFRGIVLDVSNESVAEAADRYTRTEAAPTAWDADEHEAAFGTFAALLNVTPPARVEVGGPYRDGDRRTSPATVAVGETVTVSATVANGGGAAGDYRVALTVDNRTVDAVNGTLEPGANTTVRPSWTAAAPGTYELSLRGRTYEVRVREPSTPQVASLSADRTVVERGESVRLTAEVVAGGAVPADGEVSIRVDGEPVGTERVRVAPDATATLTIPIAFDEPGRRTVTVGTRTLTVTVTEASTVTTTDASSTRTPGFGAATAATALLAALVTLIGVSRRRRSGR